MVQVAIVDTKLVYIFNGLLMNVGRPLGVHVMLVAYCIVSFHKAVRVPVLDQFSIYEALQE